MKAALLLIIATSAAVSSLAQANMKQRLVAQALYSDTNSLFPGHVALSDSAVFVYSGARHSEFDYSNMTYFDLSQASGNSAAVVARVDGLVLPNTFDSANYALRSLFDTLRHYDCSGATPQLLSEEGASYAPDGRCAETFYKTGPSLTTEKFFYAAGRLIHASGADYRNGIAGNTEERFVGYDASGNAIADSTVTYSNGQVRTTSTSKFSFDAAGRYIIWLAPASQRRNSYTYFPDGRVQTRLIEVPGANGGFVPQYLDSFSYTPGQPGYTGRKLFISFNGGWFPNGDVHFHINALGQKDSMVIRGSGPEQRDLYYLTYNSYGNPDNCTHDAYYDGDWIYRDKTFYYYERYDASLAIHETAPEAFYVTLAPNPVAGSILLSFNGTVPKVPVVVSISDAAGRCVYRSSFVPQVRSISIPLGPELAEGLYYLTANCVGNALSYKGTFLKQ